MSQKQKKILWIRCFLASEQENTRVNQDIYEATERLSRKWHLEVDLGISYFQIKCEVLREHISKDGRTEFEALKKSKSRLWETWPVYGTFLRHKNQTDTIIRTNLL